MSTSYHNNVDAPVPDDQSSIIYGDTDSIIDDFQLAVDNHVMEVFNTAFNSQVITHQMVALPSITSQWRTAMQYITASNNVSSPL